MRKSRGLSILGAGLVFALSACSQPDDGLTQLQRQVLAGSKSTGANIPEERILAASNGDLSAAYLVISANEDGPGGMKPSKKRARLRQIFD